MSYFERPVASIHDMREVAQELYDLSDEYDRKFFATNPTPEQMKQLKQHEIDELLCKAANLSGKSAAYKHAAEIVEQSAYRLERKRHEEEGE